MSEVLKKKKKKRHHSVSSSYYDAPTKRIKVEINDTADDSIVLSAPYVGLICDASVVEHRKKKKHKRQNATEVDVDIAARGNVELSRTSTDGQHNMRAVSAEHQTLSSGLEKGSSHKRPKDDEQQDSSRQQQSPGKSSQAVDQLYCPELRYTKCCVTSI